MRTLPRPLKLRPWQANGNNQADTAPMTAGVDMAVLAAVERINSRVVPAYLNTPPDATVVYITDFIAGIEYQASGVLISPDEVLTASHVVYSSDGGTAYGIQVAPGFNAGYAPYGYVSGTATHYNRIDDSGGMISFDQSEQDYAIIHLSTSFAALGTKGLLANYTGGIVNVSGYPGSAYGELDTLVESVSLDPYYTLLEGASIGKGSSGGPVWINGSQGPQVVAVISSQSTDNGGAGYFTQITSAAANQIQAWVQQDDASLGYPPAKDFNADRTSDVLFQNSNSGLLLDWQIRNGLYAGARTIAGTTPDWTVQGTGDFNHDGTVDILFRNSSSGLLLDWRLSAGTFTASTPIAATTPDWRVLGTGDFNGDGTTDILFQNSNSGLLLDWQIGNGGYVAAHAIAGTSPDWHFLGTGDFNGDGTTDILFQNANSGLLLDWQIGNGGYVTAHAIAATTPDWHFLGTGDFNGDGIDDIAFQNINSGLLVDWRIGYGTYVESDVIGGTTPDWKFAGVGDYNGDTVSDILFRNANSGLLVDWQIRDNQFEHSDVIAATTADWKIV